MPDKIDTVVATGAAALEAGDWDAARDAFTAALALGETPAALNGLSDALWWLGRTRESIELRERAYAAYRRSGELIAAVNAAFALCIHYRANVGDEAVSAGWLARATRLVEDEGLDELRGWVLLMRAGETDGPACEALARDALEHARRTKDLDLELCALAQIGSALVSQGRIDEGMALLDESMAGSLGGEGGTFDTVVFTACNMIGSCTRCAEFERAVAWIRAADRFTARYGGPFLFLYCRTLYANVLIATGDWAQAERELEIALRDSEAEQVPLHYGALATMARLRLEQGRLEEAGSLIADFGGEGPAGEILAHIQRARGELDLAAATASRALAGVGEDQLARAALTEMIASIEHARGRAPEAAAHTDALQALSDAAACEMIEARADRARGIVEGDPARLDAAVSRFAALGMPVEAARARLARATLLAPAEAAVAAEDARAALEAFERAGAAPDADEASALLRSLGVRTGRPGPRATEALTKREQEVLGLLGAGLSNPEIAERLFLSRKTVEHHVAAILRKLGLRNRAEAAAEAARGGTSNHR